MDVLIVAAVTKIELVIVGMEVVWEEDIMSSVDIGAYKLESPEILEIARTASSYAELLYGSSTPRFAGCKELLPVVSVVLAEAVGMALDATPDASLLVDASPDGSDSI
jgi:hypothetical protein